MRFMHKLTALVIGFLAVAGASGASAQVRTFKVDESGGSQIQFVSDAPLERITGKTSKASGTISVDPAKPAECKGDIKVDIASIKTGVDLRDEHLRKDNWLDAAKYPNAQFVITKVSGADKLQPNQAVELTITGKFTLHGVTKDVTTKARVRWVPAAAGGAAETLRVQATFDVKLEDHKVSIPSIVSLKVAPVVQVNVDLRASAQ